MMSTKRAGPRRRLPPEARRRQIIEATRSLLEQRRGAPISTADVAQAAGVTRALVHRYFHGIEDLLQAVAADLASRAGAVLTAGPGSPIEERVRHNVNAFLDGIEASREVWLSTLDSERSRTAEDHPGQILRNAVLQRMLANNADIIQDTPWSRLCLRSYIGSSDAACRQWVLGNATRSQVEQVLVQTLLHALTVIIPHGEQAPAQ